VSVFLIPGLGATSDLFADDQFPFLNRTVDYPALSTPAVGLSEYARQLIADNGIQPGDSLIGVSLGGLISCEIAAQMFISKLTLVSSCTDSLHLVPFIRKNSTTQPRRALAAHAESALSSFCLQQPSTNGTRDFPNGRCQVYPLILSECSRLEESCSSSRHDPNPRRQSPPFPNRAPKDRPHHQGWRPPHDLSHRAEIQPLLIARHQASAQTH